MTTKIICSIIQCPFWSGKSKRYGCQRYAFSGGCHLKVAHRELRDNEYALYGEVEGLNLTGLKRENDRFFLEDEHYAQQLQFFAEHPNLKDCSFVPKEITRD